MDDKTAGAILIGIVYPLMIAVFFGGIVFLVLKADKYRERPAKKSVPHRIRK